MVYQKILIGVFILVFFLRLPSLFEPFIYGDEGIYLTLGQAMRRGVILYREIHDNKPPMLYLLSALTGNFAYFRLLLFIWSFLTIWFFYKLSQRLFPKNQAAVLLTTGLLAVLSSIHTFEGNVANAENFMLLPTIIGFSRLLDGQFFLAGLFFSWAALFKIPAAFDFLAGLVIISFLFLTKKNKRYQSLVVSCSVFSAGFLLPFLLTFLYFASQQALTHYLATAFFQNIPYLASWVPDKPRAFSLPLPLLGRSLLVALVVLVVFFLRKKISLAGQLALVWFSFSLFASLLSSRPYPHYLLQTFPSFSLSFGLFFVAAKEKAIPLILGLTLVVSFLIGNFWHYSNLPYYLSFYQFALGRKSKQEYFASFGSEAKMVYQLAEHLQKSTQKEERLFIWGTQPSIYALSRRLPVGRYTTSYHIIDFDGYQETILALKEQKPSSIIKISSEKKEFPELERLLKTDYLKLKTIGESEVYRRLL